MITTIGQQVEHISLLGCDYENLPEDMKNIVHECYHDLAKFCKFFLGGQFEVDFEQPHLDIINAIESGNRKVVVNASRGIGKTTILRAYIARALLYRTVRFVVYVSKSETHAIEQTENIKEAISSSERIRLFFGDIRSDYVDDSSARRNRFSSKSWVANGFSLVLPRGAKQQVRGLNWVKSEKSFRPDLWVYDDLEDDEEVDNETLRKKLREWFYGSAMKAVPQHHKNWNVIYIDTLKHEDALLKRILDADDWYSVRTSYVKEEGEDSEGNPIYIATAPGFKSQEDINEDVRVHRKNKNMDIFAREVLGRPTAKEDQSFRRSMFKYYSEKDIEHMSFFLSGLPVTAVILDPAKTVKSHNAQSGIVVWTIDTWGRRLFLREARGVYYYPDQIYEDLFRTCARYNAEVLAYEETGLSEFITQPLQDHFNAMLMEYDDYTGPEIVKVNPKRMMESDEGQKVLRGKASRVTWGLMPYYRQGIVWHNAEGLADYEDQLLAVPRPARWDIIDAAAYITQLMQLGYIYFPLVSSKDQALRKEGRRLNDAETFYARENLKYHNGQMSNSWRLV